MEVLVLSDAYAKVSFRLVARQEPARVQQLFRSWVLDRVPAGVDARVEFRGGQLLRECLTDPG